MSWFESAFGKRYLQLYAHRDGKEAQQAFDNIFAAEFLEKSSALDLGCGPGRHLKELEMRCRFAVGLDLSWPLLQQSRKIMPAGTILRADMRTLPFKDTSFDLLLSMFTSFGYFESMDAHALLAIEMARVTKNTILLDLPDYRFLQENLVDSSERDLQDFQVVESRWMEPSPRKVCKDIEVHHKGSDEVEYFSERVMLFEKEEIEAFFAKAGFRLAKSFGSYAGQPYQMGKTSRMILLLERETLNG